MFRQAEERRLVATDARDDAGRPQRRPRPRPFLEFGPAVEELGYVDLFHADERFFRDVYALLAPLTHVTTTLRFGPLTTDPFSRHPALTAMAIGTPAEQSGGRTLLGIGSGSSGFQTIGVHRSRVVRRLREAIELIRLLLTSRDNVTDEGETVRFVNDRLGFGPIPHVPDVIGTRGPRVLELAGAVADQVVIGGYCSRPMIEWALAHVEPAWSARDARAATSEFRRWSTPPSTTSPRERSTPPGGARWSRRGAA